MSRQLKQELICLRKRAALKPGLDPMRNCARCLTELGRLINRGALCPVCLKKVCKDCRHYGDENHDWLCIYCYKQMQLKAISGEWMLEFSRMSVQKRAKEFSGDHFKNILQDKQDNGTLRSEAMELPQPQLLAHPAPEKPPRTFTYELPSQNDSPETSSHTTRTNISECTDSSNEKKSPDQRKDSRPSSPNLSRLSPWSDIDTDPTLPERIDKSRPLGVIHSLESMSFKERQSSDEGHISIGYRSRSMSSDVADESEPRVPVPLPRKRINPLIKQQAIPDQTIVDNQQSSIDTTDSGIFSPGIKAQMSSDTNPPTSPLVTSRLSSYEQESIDSPSFAHCLASESSLSEAEEDRRPQVKTSGGFFRKRKAAHSRSADEKFSATSADTHLSIPVTGLNNSFSNNKVYSNSLFNTNFKHKLIGSRLSFTNNTKTNSRADACRKHFNCKKNNLPGSSFQLNSKACTFNYNNLEAPATGGKRYDVEKAMKYPLLPTNQDGSRNKQRDRRRNFLPHFPHLRRKRSKKKASILNNIQQTDKPLHSTSSKCHVNVQGTSEENYLNPSTPKNKFWNGLVRSASLPSNRTFSDEWLKSWLWKCHSLGDWLWYLEEQLYQSRNFNEIVNMLPDDYKLVYVSSASSSSDSDSDSLPNINCQRQSKIPTKTYLKVNSHIKTNYGISYVEDSDWELESDDSEESESFNYVKSKVQINEANNYILNYSQQLKINVCSDGEKYACDNSDLKSKSFEKNGYFIGSMIPSLNSPVTDNYFLSKRLDFISHDSYYRNYNCTSDIRSCLNHSDNQKMKNAGKIITSNSKGNLSSWPRFFGEYPKSISLSLPFSSTMNIRNPKSNCIKAHLRYPQTYSQLQLVPNVTLLQSSVIFNKLCIEYFRPEGLSTLFFDECFYLQWPSFPHLLLIPSRFSNTPHFSSDDLNSFCYLQLGAKITSFPRRVSDLERAVLVSPSANEVSLSGESCLTSINLLLNNGVVVCSLTDANNVFFSLLETLGILNRSNFIQDFIFHNFKAIKNNSANTRKLFLNLNFPLSTLGNYFNLFKVSWKNRTLLNVMFDSMSSRRDCSEGKVGNWLQLDNANAFHYTAFPLSSYATNRGNDNSATGWGKLRCCIAVATERVIDLNLRALVCRREVLDSAKLTSYLGWKAGTEDKHSQSANLVDAFLYRNPPVFEKPEADYLFSLNRSELCVLFLRLFHARAETRMIAAKFEVTGVSAFDKVEHDNFLGCSRTGENCKKMQSKNSDIKSNDENIEFEADLSWIGKIELSQSQWQPRKLECESACFANVNKHRSAFLRWATVDITDEFSLSEPTTGDLIVSSDNHYDNTSDLYNKDDCDFLDTEILPCIKNFFNDEYSVCDHNIQMCVPSELVDHADSYERVDCQCNKPCEVPSSPSVVDATVERAMVDDGEVFSSGDELDKFESDTDSQDTVIEGEAYKRIRSVAIKEKILHANEELFGFSGKETFLNSHNSSPITNNDKSDLKPDKFNHKVKSCSLEEIKNKTQSHLHNQHQSNMPELPLFSDSEESDTVPVFSSLEKHFYSLKDPNSLNYIPVFPSFDKITVESNNLSNTNESSYCPSFNETTCSSESSDNGSDGEEVILSDTSTSSDEATYIAPSSSFQFFNAPISYKLHTIAEESCEESERSSRNSNPISKTCADFEYFDKNRLLHLNNPRKNYRKLLPDNPTAGPSNDFKSSKTSAFHTVLATSRLEKYFKSNLHDKDRLSYPDDEMTDESGEVSSDDDITSNKLTNLSVIPKISQSQFKNSLSSTASSRCITSVKNSRIGGLSSLKCLKTDSTILQQSETDLTSKIEPCTSESKQNNINEQVSDDEAKYIMNHLMQHITSNSEVKNESNSEVKDVSPMLKILESEIARLMLTVSPASLSAGEPSSSCSSTIGSNNSDYGSDTLESAEDSTSEEEISANISQENRPAIDVPAAVDSILPSQNDRDTSDNPQSDTFIPTADSAMSEETLYICKQLMASLKRIADSTDGASMSDDVCISSEDHTAKQYITDQIVSLMQTVNASQNSSPLLRRLSSNPSSLQIDSDVSQDRSDSDSPPPNDEKRDHLKSKTPSESGSETTISASISIPSYDDSDRTPTESEISHEMDELYALLESSSASQDVMSAKFCDLDTHSIDKSVPSRSADSPVSEDDINFGFSESCEVNPSSSESKCSLLYGAESKLRSLLPISIEERIARYKDAFLNKVEPKDPKLKATETRINVILPQPSMSEGVCDDMCGSNASLPLNFDSVLNVKSYEKHSVIKSCDNILSSCSVHKNEENNYSITSVKIVSHNTYPPSSAIHKILSNNIDSAYVDQSDHNVGMSSVLSDKTITSDEIVDNLLDNENKIDECSEENESTILSPLPKIINPKEKASSENDLLVANYRAKSKSTKVSGTKSVGNICELENISNKSTFRDTGYYSFKSSEESFLSLDDSTASQTSTASLTQYRSLTSTETIPEEEESTVKGGAPTKMSLSSSNIPDAVCGTSSSKSNTLPLSLRGKISSTSNVNHRTRSSFFSTSGVLRKLTLLRDESGNSLRSSPHGRLRMRNRSLSGGSEDGRQRKTSVPQISVSECLENQSSRQSTASSEKESSGAQDEDTDQHFSYPSRSQMSLSSFGGRSESVTSVYSAAGGGRYGTVIVTGDVLFGLNYNYKVGCLEINVKECRNLAAVDTKKNRSDPYVKVYLLPDRTKSGKRKTKVKKHTLNPVFDELLKFQVTVSELEIRTLWLSVWHSDRFGRNDFLGEVMLPLGNDTFESSGLKWYPLQERLETLDPPVSYKGDLYLALKYVPPDVTSRKLSKKPGIPAKGSLEVLVREARNLMATRSNGTSDPFCKSYLLPDKSKSGKQKTPVFKKSCNPKWNHNFVYDDVSLDDLRERCLELTIWDYDKITSNDFLGGVRLSLGTGKYQGREVEWMDSVGEERSLWHAMLERPNTWVEGSLVLRSNMQSRRVV